MGELHLVLFTDGERADLFGSLGGRPALGLDLSDLALAELQFDLTFSEQSLQIEVYPSQPFCDAKRAGLSSKLAFVAKKVVEAGRVLERTPYCCGIAGMMINWLNGPIGLAKMTRILILLVHRPRPRRSRNKTKSRTSMKRNNRVELELWNLVARS
jgi:hypothetical protein